ncbi:MAG: hypothetical protein D084_Lepto4C00105G0001 [Leptospirillum sp. Group IV 'UBA BS']|nr:MAG: hypothetical protein D084_Lepto4C00105G0001 [Leptospirillum sp. Group IV 'UBA BS']
MENPPFSANEEWIKSARERARKQHTTLTEAFRKRLLAYSRQGQREEEACRVIDELRGRVRLGRKLTRNAMNER